MKNLFFFIFLPLFCFGQKIDYNNFDTKLASKVLFDAICYYRDTAQTLGAGKKYSVYFKEKEIENYRDLMKLHWSDKVYNTFSYPNCKQNADKNDLFHVDITNYFDQEKNYMVFVNDIYKDFPKEQRIFKPEYSEIGAYTAHKSETYQDLATHIIMIWENSKTHRGILRKPFVRTYVAKEYKKMMYIQAACSVQYKNGKVWSFANFID